MKNFYKRILIMFVMVLTIMSVGIIKNEIVANAATVGEQLLLPEEGWRRYDDTDDRIIYSDLSTGDYSGHGISQPSSNGTYTQFTKGTCQFNFKGSKIRIIGLRSFHGSYNGYSDKIKVEIDNMPVEFYSNVGSVQFQTILYENTNLSDSEHCVKISNEDVLINTSINIDCIDVDGYLIGDKDTSISLDKSSLTIEENNTKKLTATTTPSAVGLEWSSSNEAIATVDQNGKVTGLKEGTCIVTVQIKGTDVKAICEVTVTKEDIV
ncbi:Ig-like domain-containing protein, partial [Clostridium butyricum]|uniref:Ig-like domain-containing protein n=1 Tax=Clostridium butyricum TaxID=1492 RepID=UPI0022E1E2FE